MEILRGDSHFEPTSLGHRDRIGTCRWYTTCQLARWLLHTLVLISWLEPQLVSGRMFKYERGKGLLYCTSLLAQAMCRNVPGRHWKKTSYVQPYSPHLEKKLKHWEKNLGMCTLSICCSLNLYLWKNILEVKICNLHDVSQTWQMLYYLLFVGFSVLGTAAQNILKQHLSLVVVLPCIGNNWWWLVLSSFSISWNSCSIPSLCLVVDQLHFISPTCHCQLLKACRNSRPPKPKAGSSHTFWWIDIQKW